MSNDKNPKPILPVHAWPVGDEVTNHMRPLTDKEILQAFEDAKPKPVTTMPADLITGSRGPLTMDRWPHANVTPEQHFMREMKRVSMDIALLAGKMKKQGLLQDINNAQAAWYDDNLDVTITFKMKQNEKRPEEAGEDLG
jgi:hypothetical protein